MDPKGNRAADYKRTGVWDCRQTFGKDTFDLNFRQLAAEVRRVYLHSGHDMKQIAYRVGQDAILAAEDMWLTAEEWESAGGYEAEESAVTRREAYAAWKRGYTECATESVVGWILEEIGDEFTEEAGDWRSRRR